MEPRRRGLRFGALASSVVLVGAFVVCAGGFKFLGGSKSNRMFSFVGSTVKPTSAPAAPPETKQQSKPADTPANPTQPPEPDE
jgi:hypothetical protein